MTGRMLLALGVVIFAVLIAGYLVRKAWISHTTTARRARQAGPDLELMRQKLGITVPSRPAPREDPNAPNAANYDESKVDDYQLPNPLVLKNGATVTTAEEWWKKRRPEIVEDFEREVYGRLPKEIPPVTWEVVSDEIITIGSRRAQQRMLLGKVDNAMFPEVSVEIRLFVVTPVDAVDPVPVVLNISWMRRVREEWKELLLSKGWGYAVMEHWSVQPDNGAGLRKGIIGLVNRGELRSPEDWGVLRAWAWGASRVLDYLETDRRVDARRVGLEGHSRRGKAALVAMAMDQRFSLALISSSGVGGAKIMRRNFAEQVENVVVSDNHHWFCGNFLKYGSVLTAHDLPVDAHELIALCAPRPVFISAGSLEHGDRWADPKGMFLAAVHAEPVYALLGKKGLGTTTFPPEGTPLIDGELAFRQHHGGHTAAPNWPVWVEWASRYWDVQTSKGK